MLAEMKPRQLVEWMVYADLEPFDEMRNDIRVAQIVASLWNSDRDPKKRPAPFTLADVLLRFGDTPSMKKPQTWQEKKAIGKMWAGLFNAQEREKERKAERMKKARAASSPPKRPRVAAAAARKAK
jgi:hypothetical protein